MADVRTNIFGIGEVYELQREGQWIERNRESYREYGYFGGGDNEGNLSRVNRIDYSNDTATASVRGALSAARRAPRAVGNSNFGYFSCGGLTRVDRINYSNDLATASIRGPLSQTKDRPASFGNTNFGYFCGIGRNDRIDYSNDTSISTQRGQLSSSRFYFCGTANLNYGWALGGVITFPAGGRSTVDRVDFSNDSGTASIRGPLSVSAYDWASSSAGNSNFGYLFGGRTSGAAPITQIQKISYANDLSNSSPRGNLGRAVYMGTASGNSNYGYVSHHYVGGVTGSSFVLRHDYSNDTSIVSVRGPLSNNVYEGSSSSSASFGGAPVSYLGAPWTATSPFGYFGGGNPTISTVDRVDYTNDTNTASVRGPLSLSKDALAATGNSTFGYFSGGSNPGIPAIYSTVDRIDYSNDSATASIRGSLNIVRSRFSASGNLNFGYFYGTEAVSSIDRITYSNDSVTTTSRGNLSIARRETSSSGNINFGYIYGGLRAFGGGAVSIIERIDYSNDNITLPVRNFLSSERFTTAATGNQNFGYIVNAFGSSSITQRIDYANDTGSLLSRGIISSNRFAMGATGNSNFGYFGGGSPIFSTVDRIDYSNDTQTASVRGPLSAGRRYLAASSSQAYGGAPNTTTDPLPVYIRDATKWNNSNTLELPFKRVLGSYGYFGGGSSQATSDTSSIDRVDYSNDTQTTQFRTNLSLQRRVLTATGNSNFGYFCGGENPAFRSEIDRIDYSNDVAQLSLRARISTSRGRIASGGNNNFGYIGSGYVSFVDRYDYSNDIVNAISRLNLITDKNASGFSSNNNFGYIGAGGLVPNGSTLLSRVDRIDYSNDTAIASVRGPLSLAKWFFSATGNSNFGYFGGGSSPGVVSTVDRIDYSNDTATASVRGPLSLARDGLLATGNSNFGYFGGGTPGPRSTVDRIDYSNDTQTASVRGPLSLAKSVHASSTNARNS